MKTNNMKKIIYALSTLGLVLTISSAVPNHGISNVNIKSNLISPQVSATDIYNLLNTNLGLTTTQKPVVKKAVDEAAAETTKLNLETSKSAAEVSTAKTSIVNSLIKKLSSGILTSAQSTKLAGMTSTLTKMFGELK